MPYQKHPQITHVQQGSASTLDIEIQKLLENGALCQVPFTADAFYSRLFLVPKMGGSMRPVIDLSALNQFIESPHFQMEHLSSIKTLLKPGHFMTKLDLKDAYLSVAVHPDCQKYLRFVWKNKTFQFRALPFGLNIEPQVFTRLLKPVAAFLRKRGARLVIYLDDILVNDIIINKEKSILKPTQVITFLGFTINSVNMTLNLPHDKVTGIQSQRRQLLAQPSVTLRAIAQILGTLEAARPVIWKAPLRYRMLQEQMTQGSQKIKTTIRKLWLYHHNPDRSSTGGF